jgi:hypothetical protein
MLTIILAIVPGILIRPRLPQRMQQVKESMGIVLEERNRIAQQCHDTLMAGFAAISEATMNLFRDSEEASKVSRCTARFVPMSCCSAYACRVRAGSKC